MRSGMRSFYVLFLVLFLVSALAPGAFAKVVARSLRDGTVGQGRGFVLMPDASPYGRKLSERAVENYRTVARMAAEFRL